MTKMKGLVMKDQDTVQKFMVWRDAGVGASTRFAKKDFAKKGSQHVSQVALFASLSARPRFHQNSCYLRRVRMRQQFSSTKVASPRISAHLPALLCLLPMPSRHFCKNIVLWSRLCKKQPGRDPRLRMGACPRAHLSGRSGQFRRRPGSC